jgi:hypothetical protein
MLKVSWDNSDWEPGDSTSQFCDDITIEVCAAPEFRINVGCKECKQKNCKVRGDIDEVGK